MDSAAAIFQADRVSESEHSMLGGGIGSDAGTGITALAEAMLMLMMWPRPRRDIRLAASLAPRITGSS